MTLRVTAGASPSASGDELARVHAAAFASPTSGPAPWSAATFVSMTEMDGLLWVEARDAADASDSLLGFALFRPVLDEAELLTIARDPAAAGAGVGGAALRAGLATLREQGGAVVFLEVARRNAAARRLYASAGFIQVGEREQYYHACDGHIDDALILSLSFEIS